MKKWTVGLIGLSVLSLTVGAAGNASAACQNVATADFIGQVCSSTNAEQRTGRWIVDDGGIFEGTATAVTNADGSQRVDKQGKLKTPHYDGTLYHSESKSATGAKTSASQVAGDEVLPSGVFNGTSTLVVNPDGSQRLDKQGKLRSASFDGTLYRSESKSATGAKTIAEQLAGKEAMANGGMFDGTSTLVVNPDGSQRLDKQGKLRSASFDGTLYRSESKSTTRTRRQTSEAKTIAEQLTGTWIIAPDYKLTGTYTIIWNPDGTVQVTDNRRRM